MRKIHLLPVALFAIIFIANSCKKEQIIAVQESEVPVLPAKTLDYRDITLKGPFAKFNKEQILGIGNNQQIDLFQSENPSVSNEGATLGRVLFYDKKLSLNNSVACASCHHQDKAFSDGQALSMGFEGRITPRSSMSIANANMNGSMFWDSRKANVLAMTLNPVQNHIEMGMEDMKALVNKLTATSYYPDLFKQAYGSKEITEEKISIALSQFVCSLFSGNSKYDQAVERGSFASLTPLEEKGRQLFFSSTTQCSSCHGGENFSVANSTSTRGFDGYGETLGTANIGLDVVYKDNGFGEGQFKIPSLRNIALTAPYMHDGRFKSLTEVINHYNNNIQMHKKLDKKFIQNGTPIRMNLSDVEVQAMVAFLNTLTDESFIKDERYSNPFKK